jgi:hypothetical protein
LGKILGLICINYSTSGLVGIKGDFVEAYSSIIYIVIKVLNYYYLLFFGSNSHKKQSKSNPDVLIVLLELFLLINFLLIQMFCQKKTKQAIQHTRPDSPMAHLAFSTPQTISSQSKKKNSPSANPMAHLASTI